MLFPWQPPLLRPQLLHTVKPKNTELAAAHIHCYGQHRISRRKKVFASLGLQNLKGFC
jgi:hypothetical protein